MYARIGSMLPLTALLCALAWADQAPTPAKTEPAEAEASKLKVDKSKAAATEAVKVPQTSTKKAPATPSAEVARLVRSGQIDAGRDIVKNYQRTAPPVQRAEVSLTYGNELLRASRTNKAANPEWASEAKQQFQGVIEDGGPGQQLIARNNLAAIDLEQGNSVGALKILEEGYETAKTSQPAVRSQYLFNYAEALERTPASQGRKPADLYREAFLADPRRHEAADAGLGLSLSQGNINEAADFAQLMIDRGHLELAEKRLRNALDDPKARQSPDAYLLVGSLMSLIAAQKVPPDEFGKRWGQHAKGSVAGLDDRAHAMRQFLQLGYAAAAQVPQFADPRAAREKLGMQNIPKPQVALVSSYWTQVGNVRAAAGDARAALALYSIAWQVHRVNMDAALYKANLLIQRQKEFDPDGRLFNRFIDELFQGKGEAYLGEDWPSILQFHMILGTLFYQRHEWGDSYYPRSAVFQLEHADKARRRLEGKDGGGPAPGLYTMLAECYVATQKPAQAFETYQQAARDALDIADRDLASDIMKNRIASIRNYTPTAKQSAVSAKLNERIAAAPPDPG